MGHRLSKITTRTGDKGTTGLATGLRVEKDSLRVYAMGVVDELNSGIGVVLAHGVPPQVRDCLVDVQHRLLLPGGSLAAAACHVARTVCRRAESHVVGLNTIDPIEHDCLLPFRNRLSDLLFVVARVLNKAERSAEPMRRPRD